MLLGAAGFIGAGGGRLLSRMICLLAQKRLCQLFKSWGGRPAICMLRHRDSSVDPAIKKSWHELHARRSGIRLPSPDNELTHPAAADAAYERAIARTEQCTSDRTAFPDLWDERVNYELMVNGLALRWIGLVTASGALLWSCIEHVSLRIGPHPSLEMQASMSLHSASVSVVVTSIVMTVAWLFVFTPKQTRKAACEYDRHLLESIQGGTPVAVARNRGS